MLPVGTTKAWGHAAKLRKAQSRPRSSPIPPHSQPPPATAPPAHRVPALTLLWQLIVLRLALHLLAPVL